MHPQKPVVGKRRQQRAYNERCTSCDEYRTRDMKERATRWIAVLFTASGGILEDAIGRRLKPSLPRGRH
jgi:hypothetical protein